MDLQQTIAELEKQAAQYTEAANSLRALLQQESGSPSAGRPQGAVKAAAKKSGRKSTKQGGAKQGSSKQGAKKRAGKKAAVSPETRAKISEALRASHAARKAQSA